MKNISKEEIPDYEFEGYYWYSNAKLPQYLNGKINNAIFRDLPFIVEGHFYSRRNDVSISIKNISGRYIIIQYNLKDLRHLPNEKVAYYNAKNERQRLNFLYIWKAKADLLCEGMGTLQPYCSPFIGF